MIPWTQNFCNTLSPYHYEHNRYEMHNIISFEALKFVFVFPESKGIFVKINFNTLTAKLYH